MSNKETFCIESKSDEDVAMQGPSSSILQIKSSQSTMEARCLYNNVNVLKVFGDGRQCMSECVDDDALCESYDSVIVFG